MRGHFQIFVHFPVFSSRSAWRVDAGARSLVARRVSAAGLPILPTAFDCSPPSKRQVCARSGHTPRSAVHFLALRRLEGEPWDRRSPDRLRSTQSPSVRQYLRAFRCANGGTNSQMTFIPQGGPSGHPDSCLRPNDTRPCQQLATQVSPDALHLSVQAAQPGMKRRRQ
jgi:hypothetical protein